MGDQLLRLAQRAGPWVSRLLRDCGGDRVKPERQERGANGDFKKRKPLPQLYWIYAEKRPKLYRTIEPLARVLAISRVGKAVQPVLRPHGAGAR